MTNKILRLMLVIALALAGSIGWAGNAVADIDNSDAQDNMQEGDNDSSSQQSGSSESGDAVGGQVTGIVSSGDASVDATNRSEDVDVESGDVEGNNTAATFTGLNQVDDDATITAVADITNANNADNLQEGDNESAYDQTVSVSSGDGVGGQVIGAVTSAGGSADIVADNTSEDVDIETGEANASNALAAFVGLQDVEDDFLLRAADIDNVDVEDNLQEGDNDGSFSQDAAAASGDGVGGQVIGAVAAGDTSIDATNVSEDVDIDTGDAESNNALAGFVGLSSADDTQTITALADITNSDSDENVQEGDNEASLAQDASSSTGDGVGGQVIGAVTSAGGSADIVADNTSEDVDIDTGDALAENALAAFVGLSETDDQTITAVADIDNVDSDENLQEGDNELEGSQSASAASGDGVGGQVLGAVAAGDTSIDATNVSEDVDVETGDTNAANSAAAFVGLNHVQNDSTITAVADITNSDAQNLQEGDNSRDFGQTADSASGDAVAGQVAGVVTSAGGSADAVLDNVSEDVDAESGESTFFNADAGFVGLNEVEDDFNLIGL